MNSVNTDFSDLINRQSCQGLAASRKREEFIYKKNWDQETDFGGGLEVEEKPSCIPERNSG